MLENSMQFYLLITTIVFVVVATIHLLRAINSWAFVIGPLKLPMAVSWIGFIVTATLGLWAMLLLTA